MTTRSSLATGTLATGTPACRVADNPRARSRLMRAVVRQFGRPSGALGALAGWIMARRPSNRRRNLRTVELLGIEPDHRVLEIGCGPGLALQRVLSAPERVPGLRVAGIDHSPVMLRQAARRNAAAVRDGRLDLRVVSIESLPLRGERFDRVFAVNVLPFRERPGRVLEHLREHLAPGRRLALTVQPRGGPVTQCDVDAAGARMLRLLEGAGFRRARLERLELRPVDAVCALADLA